MALEFPAGKRPVFVGAGWTMIRRYMPRTISSNAKEAATMAINDAGLKIPMYTYYAGVTGTPTALAAGGDSEVYVVAYGHANHTGELGQIAAEFRHSSPADRPDYLALTRAAVAGARI